jgi:glutathionylspermidine synthase
VDDTEFATAFEQLRKAVENQVRKDLQHELLKNAKKFNKKLELANKRASEWKENYSRTRKLLLLSQAEVRELKRGKDEKS